MLAPLGEANASARSGRLKSRGQASLTMAHMCPKRGQLAALPPVQRDTRLGACPKATRRSSRSSDPTPPLLTFYVSSGSTSTETPEAAAHQPRRYPGPNSPPALARLCPLFTTPHALDLRARSAPASPLSVLDRFSRSGFS